MRVGIEEPRNRTVMEGVNSTVEYCVVITGSDPIERSSFFVCVSTMDGTAMGKNKNCVTYYWQHVQDILNIYL